RSRWGGTDDDNYVVVQHRAGRGARHRVTTANLRRKEAKAQRKDRACMFADRRDAALKLAAKLHKYKGQNPLVLGIPRGAVPMARIIAEQLDGEVDVVLVRKLHAPGNPEFAVGAVEESGWTFVAPYAAAVGAAEAYIERERAGQLELIRTRRREYTAHRPRMDPTGRIVIVVDDG